MLKKLIVLASMLTLTACQGSGPQSTPEGVIQKIFDAAKSRDLGQLSSLCASRAETTAHIICEMSEAQPEQKEKFVRQFLKTEILGHSEVIGYSAIVKAATPLSLQDGISFKLVQENGTWYLQRFQE